MSSSSPGRSHLVGVFISFFGRRERLKGSGTEKIWIKSSSDDGFLSKLVSLSSAFYAPDLYKSVSVGPNGDPTFLLCSYY